MENVMDVRDKGRSYTKNMRVFHGLMTHPLFSFILFFMPTAIISYFG